MDKPRVGMVVLVQQGQPYGETYVYKVKIEEISPSGKLFRGTRVYENETPRERPFDVYPDEGDWYYVSKIEDVFPEKES